jgi:hypothetical protein
LFLHPSQSIPIPTGTSEVILHGSLYSEVPLSVEVVGPVVSTSLRDFNFCIHVSQGTRLMDWNAQIEVKVLIPDSSWFKNVRRKFIPAMGTTVAIKGVITKASENDKTGAISCFEMTLQEVCWLPNLHRTDDEEVDEEGVFCLCYVCCIVLLLMNVR